MLAVAAMTCAGLVAVGDAASRRARADAVADLVALAAVTGDRDGASQVAGANGARLVASALGRA